MSRILHLASPLHRSCKTVVGDPTRRPTRHQEILFVSLAPTPTARYGNIAALLWRAASERPNETAIIQSRRHVTYLTLRDQAAGVAQMLEARGVEKGDRVAILLERSAEAAAAIFGVQALGA